MSDGKDESDATTEADIADPGVRRLLYHLRMEVRLLSLLLVVVAFFAWGPLPALGVLFLGLVGSGAIHQLVRRKYPPKLDEPEGGSTESENASDR